MEDEARSLRIETELALEAYYGPGEAGRFTVGTIGPGDYAEFLSGYGRGRGIQTPFITEVNQSADLMYTVPIAGLAVSYSPDKREIGQRKRVIGEAIYHQF